MSILLFESLYTTERVYHCLEGAGIPPQYIMGTQKSNSMEGIKIPHTPKLM